MPIIDHGSKSIKQEQISQINLQVWDLVALSIVLDFKMQLSKESLTT